MTKKDSILAVTAVVALLLSWVVAVIIPVTRGYFNFTFDFSRDMLWVKNQIDFGVPAIVGPWGSLNGLFFGPLWYWLLSIPYLLGDGSPIAASLFDTAFILMTILIGFFLFLNEDKKLAVFFLLFSLASPAMKAIAGYAFAQNMLPFFTLCIIYSYTKLLSKFQIRFFLLVALAISLMYHAEPPTSVISLLSLLPIIFLSKEKKAFFTAKSLISFVVVFLTPFLPVIVFDFRHQFIQVKSILSYVQGQNESLQGILPIGERVTDRLAKFSGTISGGITSNPQLAGIFLVVLAFFNSLNPRESDQDKFSKKLLVASAVYTGTLLIGFLIFKSELKSFYLSGLFVVSIIMLSAFCARIWLSSRQKLLVACLFTLVCWFSFDPPGLIKAYREDFMGAKKTNGMLFNQKSAVDWIYQTAGGEGFNVYVYSAAIYDYPYQYLFMTHGLKKYGYLPADFSYLPGRPNYVEKKTEQLAKNKDRIKQPAKFMYLVIDSDNSRESEKINWLRYFSASEQSRFGSLVLNDGTVVERRLLIE